MENLRTALAPAAYLERVVKVKLKQQLEIFYRLFAMAGEKPYKSARIAAALAWRRLCKGYPQIAPQNLWTFSGEKRRAQSLCSRLRLRSSSQEPMLVTYVRRGPNEVIAGR